MNSYYSELPSGMEEEMLITFLVIFLGVLGVVLVFSLVFWILRSLSLMKIAKRRGIRNAWLAWIPVGNYWVLGSVSDQYQHLVQGKVTSRRKIMLILAAVSFVLGGATIGLSLVQEVAMIMQGEEESAAMLLTSSIPAFLNWGVGIAALVFYHICNYDLYRSCNPKNATAFLVLGIIFSVCEPFFYLACRNKDLGMVIPETAAPAEPAELPPVSPEF